MTEKLQKLTRQELHGLAGEIVRALSGKAAAPEAPESETERGGMRFDGEMLANLLHLMSRTENLSDEARQEKSAAKEEAAARNTAAHRGVTERFSDGAAETASTAALPDLLRENRAAQPDMAAFSDYFRRDSRRYDSGFERF